VAHDGHGGASESKGEGEQGEELQDEQRVALETLKEGRRLPTVASRRRTLRKYRSTSGMDSAPTSRARGESRLMPGEVL
jgi:hypothetical protein